MFSNILGVIDRGFGVIFGAVLKFLCKTTGQDNFFFARLMCLLSPLVISSEIFPYSKFTPFAIILVGLSAAVVAICLSMIKQSIHRLEVVRDMYPFTGEEVERARMARMGMFFLAYGNLSLTLFSVKLGVVSSVSLACVGVAFYFLLDVRPRTKGPLKRVSSWLRQHRPHMPRIPLPRPMPIPTQG